MIPHTSRNTLILAARREGLSYGDIGKRFGISRQRAHAIVDAAAAEDSVNAIRSQTASERGRGSGSLVKWRWERGYAR